jgi:hypothetical protein
MRRHPVAWANAAGSDTTNLVTVADVAQAF